MKREWLEVVAGVLAWTAALAIGLCVVGAANTRGAGTALASSPEVLPTITEVAPSSAPNDINTAAVITGTGFTTAPTVSLGTTVLDDVGWVSSELLTATVPWGLEAGVYTMTIENPGGESGSLACAFTVTQGIGVWTTDGPYGGRAVQVALNPATPTTAYAAMFQVGIFASVDEGANWEPILANDGVERITFDAIDSDVIYVGGDNGLPRTLDGGVTWEMLPELFHSQNGCYSTYPAPHPGTAGILYAGTGSCGGIPVLPGEGGIYYSDDYGDTWVTRTAGLADTDIIDIAFHPNDPDTMAAATLSGDVFTSTDAGLTWNWAADVDRQIRRLYFDPSGDPVAWIVPHTEYQPPAPVELYKSTSPGLSSWVTLVLTSDLSNGGGIWTLTFDSGDIWAAGDQGYKSADGGATWAPVVRDPDLEVWPSVRSFAIAPGGGVILAADSTLSMFKSDDGGATWLESYDGLAGLELRAMAVPQQSPDTVYALTYERGLLRSDHGGRSWRSLDIYRGGPGGGELLAADPFQPKRVYLGSYTDDENLPSVQISDDGGENWQEITMTLPYAGPDWSGEITSVGANPHVPGRVLAGGTFYESAWQHEQGIAPSGFYASDDYGLSWAFMGPTPPISQVVSFAFDASDAYLVYAGTRGTGLYRSADGGGNWQSISFPGILPPVYIEAMAAHPDTPNKVYVRLYTFAHGPNPQPQLFVSTDAGDTWEELTDLDTVFGGSGGVDLAFLPPDAGTAPYEIYSGCSVGLCRMWESNHVWEQEEGAPRPDILVSATDGERNILYIGTRGGLVSGSGQAKTTSEAIPGWGSVFGGGVYRWTKLPYGQRVYLPLLFRSYP